MVQTRYTHAYLQRMVACTECGAVVQDADAHDRWHDDVLTKMKLADVLENVRSPNG